MQNRFTTQPNCLASQFWRLVAHEVRVISTKNKAFQALSITKNIAWNLLTFSAKKSTSPRTAAAAAPQDSVYLDMWDNYLEPACTDFAERKLRSSATTTTR